MGWQDAPIVKPAAKAKAAWEDAPVVKPASQEKKPAGVKEAFFPTASRSPAQAIGYANPYSMGHGDPRATLDLLGAPVRAAGAAAGLAGYHGATGGEKGFLEGMADPETGLLRPVRGVAGGLVSSGWQGGPEGRGLLDYGMMAAGVPLYLAASVAEDPAAILALAARPVVSAAQATGRLAKKGAKAADKYAGRLAEEASGVPEEALRAWGTKEGRAAIKTNAGKEFEIGQDLVTRIENFDDYLPEKAQVDAALERMPAISPKAVQEALRKSKTATTLTPGKPKVVEVTHKRLELKPSTITPEDGPARNRSFDQLTGEPEIKVKDAGEEGKALADIPTGDVANKKIDDLIGRLKLIAGEDVHTGQQGKIPAKKFRDLRVSYDSEAKAAFKKDDRELLERALMNARNQMAADLRQAAKEGGDEGFAQVMESYSGKLDKLERVKKFLGQNADTREARAEGFVANLLNQNKTAQQNLVKDLEDIFDADFMGRVQGAKWAKQIGKDGEPALLPRQMTGRSNLAQTLLSGASFPFSSPAMASRVTLPLLRKLATAKMPAEKAFYVKKLQALGVPAAEIQAAVSAAEAIPSNAIPFRKVAERDKKPQPVALR